MSAASASPSTLAPETAAGDGQGKHEIFGSLEPFADPAWYSTLNTPYYKESHKRLRAFYRKFTDEEINPHALEWEEAGEVPMEVIKRFSELGLTAATIYPCVGKDILKAAGVILPGGVDPDEWDIFHDLITTDELGRCASLGVGWAVSGGNAIGTPPIINWGTEEQKKRFLPDIISGKTRICLGVTEPYAGSDVANLRCEAKRTEDGKSFIVNGSKKWITTAMYSDYCTTAVRTGGPGMSGISVLIIPLNAKGVQRIKLKNSGVNASGSTRIEFDDVIVPAENLIGEENQGFRVIMTNFNHERLWGAVGVLRMARNCVEDAYKYALVRETFGKPLIERQAIRMKFADMGRLIESHHAWVEQICYHWKTTPTKQADKDLAGILALAKVNGGRILELCVREAQQVLGGAGYQRGHPFGGRIEQASRDLRVVVVGAGSDEIMSDFGVRQLMFRHMQKKAAREDQAKM